MSRRIAVLDYGSGNLHSVSRALAHVGGDVAVTDDADAVERADAVVIPGVGHFGQCVRALRAGGMDRQIERFAASERPMLGVCIGMQVLFEGSEEDPEPGLGLVERDRPSPAADGAGSPHGMEHGRASASRTPSTPVWRGRTSTSCTRTRRSPRRRTRSA